MRRALRSLGRVRALPSRGLATTRHAQVFHCELSEVAIPALSFPSMVWSRAAGFAEQPALVDGATGAQLTFAEARGQARAFGSALLRLGAQRGEVMAIVMPNSPDYVTTFLGASEAGLTITTLNPIYTPHEIRGQLTNSESKYVVTTPPLLPKVLEAIGDSAIQVILAGPGDPPPSCLALAQLLKDSGDLEPSTPATPSELCVLPYSSGTTGVPKGVMLTHANLVANMAQLNHPALDLMADGETTLCVLPMFHIFAMNVTMSNMLLNGGKLVTLPSFDPAQFLAAMLEHRPTFLHVAPPLVGFLVAHPAVTPEHLASLRQIFCAAAPAGPALIEQWGRKAPGVRFREGYGMTEMAPAVTFVRGADMETGSTGQLVPNTSMKVLDLTTGEELATGETGELCFQGPQVMPGYFRNPGATAETLVEGWCHTGDIGYYDQEGRVFIVDRKKELIKVKGLQVAPAELENHIRGIAGVADVAVIGVADDRAGEVPRAYVVRGDPALTEEHVKSAVASALSPHKHLQGGVEFLTQIPKSAAGKILRKELRAAYKA